MDAWKGRKYPVLIDQAAGFRPEAFVCLDHQNAFSTGPTRHISAKTYMRLRSVARSRKRGRDCKRRARRGRVGGWGEQGRARGARRKREGRGAQDLHGERGSRPACASAQWPGAGEQGERKEVEAGQDGWSEEGGGQGRDPSDSLTASLAQSRMGIRCLTVCLLASALLT